MVTERRLPLLALAEQVLPAIYRIAAASEKVELMRSGVADGAGRIEVNFAELRHDQAVILSRVRVWVDGSTSQTEGRLYVIGGRFLAEEAATLLTGTVTGNSDVAEGEPHTIYPAQTVRFVWSGSVVDAVGTCVLEGSQVPLTVEV